MKSIKLFLSLAIAASLSACNSGGNTATSEESTAPAAEAAEAPAPQAEAHGSVIDLTPDQLPIPGTTPMVIDCWATWCGPCMQFKPIYHKVAGEYADKAIFMAADVDQCQSLAQKYGITSIPTVIVLKPGQEPILQVGSMTEEEFKTFLDKSL